MNYKYNKIGKKIKLFLYYFVCYMKFGVNFLYIGFVFCVWVCCNYI